MVTAIDTNDTDDFVLFTPVLCSEHSKLALVDFVYIRRVKGLRQSLKRGATAKASASSCTWQNVQVAQ